MKQPFTYSFRTTKVFKNIIFEFYSKEMIYPSVVYSFFTINPFMKFFI